MNLGEIINFVVVGDENTGKTTLLRIAANEESPQHDRNHPYNKTTLSSPRATMTAHERRDYEFAINTTAHGSVRLRGMDTVSSQEGIDSAALKADRQKRYQCRPDFFLVCCSLDNKQSYESAKSRWIPELRDCAGGANKDKHGRRLPIIIVVGTKEDKRARVIASKAPVNESASGGSELPLYPPGLSAKDDASLHPTRQPDHVLSPDTPNVDEQLPALPEERLKDLVNYEEGHDLAASLGAYNYEEIDSYEPLMVTEMLERCIDILSNPKAKPLVRNRGNKCGCTIL